MKLIRHTLTLALVTLLLSGCIASLEEYPGAIEMPRPEGVVNGAEPVDVYHLHISFKDQAGNDLLEPFAYYKSDPSRQKYWGEVDPALYSLNIIASSWSTPFESYFTLSKYDGNHSWITPDENGIYGDTGTWYLTNSFRIVTKNDESPYSPLRYVIKCKSLFGSIVSHPVVTWWEEGTRDGKQHYPVCARATFAVQATLDKEITPVKGITYNENNEPYYVGYFLDIVLDK